VEKGCFGGKKERFVRIKGFLHIKRRFLQTVKSCSNKRCFDCENERLFRAKREAFYKWQTFGLRKRQTFSVHAKPPKTKSFFQHTKLQLSTAPKLTRSCKFYPRQPTVSLQYNNPFSKNIGLASALRSPFRTDSKPLRQRFADKTGFDTCRRNFLQNHFRQSFESWVAGLRPVCFLVLFAQRKKHEKRPFRRKFRGLANLESANRNGSFAPQQLKPF
jgi:hypothetical protein